MKLWVSLGSQGQISHDKIRNRKVLGLYSVLLYGLNVMWTLHGLIVDPCTAEAGAMPSISSTSSPFAKKVGRLLTDICMLSLFRLR